MKVTFPYMGPTFAFHKFFELLGHEVISPSRPSRKTIELGIKHSPEFICFPFKIILGSFLEAAAQGTEIIVTSGGIGACRAVYYGRLSEQILQQLGYNVKVIVFDTLFEDLNGFLRQCRQIMNGKSFGDFMKALNLTVRLIYAHDRLQKKLNHIRAYESEPGFSNQVWKEILLKLEKTNDIYTLRQNIKQANRLISAIPASWNRDVLKIGLVGEIYLVMESAANFDLESRLALGRVEVLRSWYLSEWVTHCIFPPYPMLRATKKYLQYEVGGHERDSIGHMVEYHKLGCDGVIHLMPFGCMPELVTQTIIPTLSRDLDLPILSLSIDEQAGWINYQIRLEAFTELLWSRREVGRVING